MGIQSDIADLAELKRLADWARACVWPVEVADARLGKSAREFMAAASPEAVLALIAEMAALRKDAERYRWFRDHSIQIVHTSTICWAFHLDKLIDDAMSPGYYAIRNQPSEV